MKKLIGLLGAAGLLIPSAAMAGSIGNIEGSSAVRTTGATYGTQVVKVDSEIYRQNDMYVYGTTEGNSTSISADDYVAGGGALTYSEHDLTGQSAGGASFADLTVKGDWDIDFLDRDHSTHRTARTVDGKDRPQKKDDCRQCGPKSKKGHGKHRPERGPDKKVVKTERHNSRDVLDTKGKFEGSANGSTNFLGSIDTQTSVTTVMGGAAFTNGSFNTSYDAYTGGYKGDLFEKGTTTTSVEANTASASTSNGFESGSFNTTEWN